MQDSQLISEGLSLMVLGMGFVFVFLTVLVITTTLMSRIIGRYFPEPVALEAPRRGAAAAASEQNDAVMAAISAAVHRYRQRR